MTITTSSASSKDRTLILPKPVELPPYQKCKLQHPKYEPVPDKDRLTTLFDTLKKLDRDSDSDFSSSDDETIFSKISDPAKVAVHAVSDQLNHKRNQIIERNTRSEYEAKVNSKFILEEEKFNRDVICQERRELFDQQKEQNRFMIEQIQGNHKRALAELELRKEFHLEAGKLLLEREQNRQELDVKQQLASHQMDQEERQKYIETGAYLFHNAQRLTEQTQKTAFSLLCSTQKMAERILLGLDPDPAMDQIPKGLRRELISSKSSSFSHSQPRFKCLDGLSIYDLAVKQENLEEPVKEFLQDLFNSLTESLCEDLSSKGKILSKANVLKVFSKKTIKNELLFHITNQISKEKATLVISILLKNYSDMFNYLK